MTPLTLFLSYPLRERLALLAGGVAVGVLMWLFAWIVLGGLE